MPARDVQHVRQCTLLELVGLTHVEDDRTTGGDLSLDFQGVLDVADPKNLVGLLSSAQDRARTIAVAIADGTRPGDLIRPGRLQTLRAVDGGVLARRGILFQLVALEVALSGPALAFVAAGAYHADPQGQGMFILVLTLAAAVRPTIGPKARTVVLERSFGAPTVINSGVIVAQT